MKRKLALLLAVAMMLSMLAACGSSDSSDDTEDEAEETTEETEAAEEEETEEAEEETEEEEEETEEEEEAEEEETTSTPTEVTIGSTAANFVGHFDSGGVFSMEGSYPASYLCYDNILYNDPLTGDWNSDILESWEWSEDTENCLVLTLKDGVYFTSGDQMTAEDIWYSLYRAAEAQNFIGNFAYVEWEESKPEDETSLVLNLQFNCAYSSYASLLRAVVLNESWIEDLGGEDEIDWFDPDSIDGSGPYIVTEFTDDISTTYELKDDWWMADEAAEMDNYCVVQTITTLQYSDSTTMMVDYETGTLDVILDLSTSDYESVLNDSSLGTAVAVSSNYVSNITFGVDNNEIFDNMNLRMAMCYGTDADTIAETVYGALGVEAESSLPSTNPYFISGYTYEYDPDLAAEYLQAYYDETGTSSVELDFIAISGSTSAEIAELFAAYMEAIGITINLGIYDQGVAVEEYFLIEGANDIQVNCSDQANLENDANTCYEHYLESDTFYATHRTGEEINELLNTGLFTIDEDVLTETYTEIQEYFYNNYELIPICEWEMGYAYHDDILSEVNLIAVTRPNLRYMG